jgi:hypothetical protein
MLKPLIAGLVTLASLGATAAPVAVIPVDQPFADRTQEMWSARWWMWASSFGDAPSPVRDLTGDLCGKGQEGDVFFLAGTFARGPIHRTCKVPAGKHLFFPLVNYIVMPDGMAPCDYLANSARGMTDDPLLLFAEIDGQRLAGLEKQRIATASCFNVNALGGGAKLMSASNGYWLMLKPLAAGKHELHFGGMLPSLRQDVSYTLLVE